MQYFEVRACEHETVHILDKEKFAVDVQVRDRREVRFAEKERRQELVTDDLGCSEHEIGGCKVAAGMEEPRDVMDGKRFIYDLNDDRLKAFWRGTCNQLPGKLVDDLRSEARPM